MDQFTRQQAKELRDFWDGTSAREVTEELPPLPEEDEDTEEVDDFELDEYEEPDDLDIAEYFQRTFQNGVPSSWLMTAGMVGAAGAAGWFAWRWQQRRKFAALMKCDPRTSGYPDPDSIAANVITFTNTITAKAAFEKFAGGDPGILTEVLAALPQSFCYSIESLRDSVTHAASTTHSTSNKAGETANSVTSTIKGWLGF